MAVPATHNPRIGMVAARLEHLQRIESYGIARVELVILDRAEEPAIRRHLARARPVVSVHCPLFRDCGLEGYPLLAAVFDTDLDRQEASLQLMERELPQAAQWGATHVVVHLQRSIGVIGELAPPGWTERQALDAALKGGERLARAAERAGIGVHIENMMSQPLLARPEAYLELFEALSASRVAMCLDVGHAALDARKYGFGLSEFAALLAPRVGSLHVYNNQVLARNPEALVTFEVYFALDTDRDQTREGVEWLSRYCARYWSAP